MKMIEEQVNHDLIIVKTARTDSIYLGASAFSIQQIMFKEIAIKLVDKGPALQLLHLETAQVARLNFQTMG
jgi:hypothetical protein